MRDCRSTAPIRWRCCAAGGLLAGVLRLYRRETTLLDHLINVSEDNAERATGLN